MALNFKKIWEGLKIVKKTSSTADSVGDIEVLSDNKLHYHNGTSTSPVVTESHSATLTNKTFDANGTGNSISNIETADLAFGVLVTSVISSATDTQIPSAKAVYDALGNQNDASEINFTPITGVAGPKVQDAIEQVQGNLEDHIDNATAAHAASAISVSPTVGSESDVQSALEAHQAHVDASTNVHGLAVGSSVVGTTDTQELTNKTLTGASIEEPIRSDVKQDTLANLTTYAASATNGQIVFATDEKKMFQVVDGALVAIGGAGIAKLTAGENISANDQVYISTGTGNDSARTAGRIYKADASNDDRADVLGFAPKAITSGAIGEVQTSGNLAGLSGLTAGKIYYTSASTPGLITATPPSTDGQWIIPSALAVSASEIVINPVASASAVYVTSAEASFTVVNNQSSAASITGLLFSGLTTRAFSIDYSIYRQTDTASSALAQMGQLRGVYNTQSASWFMSDDFSGQNAGVTFIITSGGQIQYISSDLGAGANYVGTLKFVIRQTLGV
jgi:hypothetical protein